MSRHGMGSLDGPIHVVGNMGEEGVAIAIFEA